MKASDADVAGAAGPGEAAGVELPEAGLTGLLLPTSLDGSVTDLDGAAKPKLLLLMTCMVIVRVSKHLKPASKT